MLNDPGRKRLGQVEHPAQHRHRCQQNRHPREHDEAGRGVVDTADVAPPDIVSRTPDSPQVSRRSPVVPMTDDVVPEEHVEHAQREHARGQRERPFASRQEITQPRHSMSISSGSSPPRFMVDGAPFRARLSVLYRADGARP